MQESFENLFIFVGFTLYTVNFLNAYVQNNQKRAYEGEFGRFFKEKKPFFKRA